MRWQGLLPVCGRKLCFQSRPTLLSTLLNNGQTKRQLYIVQIKKQGLYTPANAWVEALVSECKNTNFLQTGKKYFQKWTGQ